MDESGTKDPERATERPWEVFMRISYREAWKPWRESAIVAVLCVLMPIVFVAQVIALVYPGGPA